MRDDGTSVYVCAGCGGEARRRYAPVVCSACDRPTMDRVGRR